MTALNAYYSALDALDEALHQQRVAARRVNSAREAFEDAVAGLYRENRIVGKNREERDACLRYHTADERYEMRDAGEAYENAAMDVALVRLEVERLKKGFR